MIHHLRLRNFKCFREVDLPFGAITVLSGSNGTGKSSVLQAMLLLRQSYQLGLLNTRGLALNGDLVRLGSGKDAWFEGAEEDVISFEMSIEGGLATKWSFRIEGQSDVLPLNQPPEDRILEGGLFGKSFHYLQAERTGPRTSFAMSDSEVLRNRRLGTRGEYCAHFLAAFEREDIQVQRLAHPDAVSFGLRDQAEAWISCVSPGTRIHVSPQPRMDLVNLEFSKVTGSYVSDPYRATNVGFGLSYTLPIFVAALSSQPGGLLMIENPEAHLHPAAQVKMAEFLALAAAGGIQVIIETHSDHVLNGVRLAVHYNVLAPHDVQLHFFRASREEVGTEVVSPKLNSRGRIDHWPEGFFDEFEKSLDELLD